MEPAGVTQGCFSQPPVCPQSLDEALKYCNYVFTIVFVIEAVLKLVAFGFRRFFKDRFVGGPQQPQAPWGSWSPGTSAGGRQETPALALVGSGVVAVLSCALCWPGGTSWTWPLSCCPSWALRWRRLR